MENKVSLKIGVVQALGAATVLGLSIASAGLAEGWLEWSTVALMWGASALMATAAAGTFANYYAETHPEIQDRGQAHQRTHEDEKEHSQTQAKEASLSPKKAPQRPVALKPRHNQPSLFPASRPRNEQKIQKKTSVRGFLKRKHQSSKVVKYKGPDYQA